jgi:hypothetical protein
MNWYQNKILKTKILSSSNPVPEAIIMRQVEVRFRLQSYMKIGE